MLDRVTGGSFAFFVWKVNKWLADPDSLFTACPWAAMQMVARPTYSQYHKYSSTFLYHVFSVSSSKLLRRGHEVWLFSVVAGQHDVLSAQWLSLLARHLVLIQKDPSFRFLGFPYCSGSWILTFLGGKRWLFCPTCARFGKASFLAFYRLCFGEQCISTALSAKRWCDGINMLIGSVIHHISWLRREKKEKLN